MTLFWHDHFATTDQDTPMMLAQNRMFRRHALGRFPDLLQAVTSDPAMLLFLSLADSDQEAPNENFARELMELFTLGRGYTERDIREASRALTGFRADWHDDGSVRTYYDRESHDSGRKRSSAAAAATTGRTCSRLCVSHPAHARSSWTSCGTSSWARRRPGRRAARPRPTYRRSGHRIKPVVAAILAHPALYRHLDAPDMVKSPVVFVAGALRSSGQSIERDAWAWLLDGMGQSCSARRRWPAGTGAPRGSPRTRCTRASTPPTTCSTRRACAWRTTPPRPAWRPAKARGAGPARGGRPVDLARDRRASCCA